MSRTIRKRVRKRDLYTWAITSLKEERLFNSDKYAYSWKKLGSNFKKESHSISRSRKRQIISNVLKSPEYDFDGATLHITKRERSLKEY